VRNNLADRLGLSLNDIYYMFPLTHSKWDIAFAISSNKLDIWLSATDLKKLSKIILAEFKGSDYGWWLDRSDIEESEEDYGVVDASDDEDAPKGRKENRNSESREVQEILEVIHCGQ